MTAPNLTDKQLYEALAYMRKAGGNKTEAARLMGIPRETFKHRLEAATMRSTAPKPSREIDERVELRDQIRTLKAQINSFNKSTLDEQYVKEKIIGLRDAPVHPPQWLVKTPKSKSAPGVPTLFASDWHMGERVFLDQTAGVNQFDMKIAHARIRRLITNTIDLLQNHMVNPSYPGLVFALGGDLVSGGIHEELLATDELEIMPVVVDLIGILIWCIDTLVVQFGHLYCPAVTGNHGRSTHKIRAKGRCHTSYDWLIYQILAKHYENDARVQFNIPNGPDCLYKIYETRYLLTHGDQFRGGDSMIGHLGPVFRGSHKKSSRDVQIKQEFDVMILGHFHSLAMLPRIITNGSLKGYDEYAYAGNYTFERPQQALWITNAARGVTFNIPVHVDEKAIAKDSEWVSSWK